MINRYLQYRFIKYIYLSGALVPFFFIILLFVFIIAAASGLVGKEGVLVHQGDFMFPLTSEYTFTQDYGQYTDGSGAHYGVDLHTDIGNEIISVSNGRVIEAVNGVPDNPIPSNYEYPPYAHMGFRGNYVTIESIVDTKKVFFRYMHMQKDSIAVRPNQIIKKGTRLGNVGNSGLSWGAHLHFEVRKGLGIASLDTLDPKQFLYFGELGGTYDPKDLKKEVKSGE